MATSRLELQIVGRDAATPAFNQVSAASRKLDADTKRVASSQGKASSAFRTTRRVLAALATSYAAVQVGRFAKDSINAASDLNEAMTATGVVFGKQGKQIKAWSKDSAAQFGQSRTQALSTARQFGTLFKSAGVSGKQLSGYSRQVTELASDIASFNNVPVQQAIDDLSSGLTGQTEPMRKYGVFLSDARLKAKALAMGIYEGTGTLTDQQRTLASYQLVLEQTGVTSDKYAKQTGDFLRTSKGYANQTRILASNWENLKATAGKALLPLATDVAGSLNKALPAIEKSLRKGQLADALEDIGPKARRFFGDLRDNLPQISGLAQDFADAGRTIGGVLKSAFGAFMNLPDGVREGIILLGTAAATMKVLNRAAGGGGMTMFSTAVESIPHAVVRAGAAVAAAESVKLMFGQRFGRMNIQAGVVNVNGKVTGGAGGKGGALGGAGRGGAAAGVVSLLGTAAVSAAITAAAGYAVYTLVDPEPKRRESGGNPTIYAGGYGSSRSITPTGTQWRPEGAKQVAEAAAEAAKQAKLYATRLLLMPPATRKAAIEANKLADAATRAADKKVAKVTVRGAKQAAKDAEELATKLGKLARKDAKPKVQVEGAAKGKSSVDDLRGSIGRVKGKSVRVRETEADRSRGKVSKLDAGIKGLRGKSVKVGVDGVQQAQSQVLTLQQYLNGLRDKTVTTTYREIKAYQTKNAATGGLILGPGGPTDDQIPAMLSNGEYVIRAASVARYGRDFLDSVNAGTLGAFANGGEVRKATVRELRQSRAEAARQARLAQRIESRNLGGSAASYLQSLSSRAALQLLADASDKQIRRLARRSESVSRLQDKRQRAQDKAREDKQRARDQLREQAEAAREQAQAQADAQDAALERVNQLRDAVDSAAGAYRSFASIGTLAVTDVAEAQSKLSEATDKVAAARKRLDLAGSDRERAEAASELAGALKEQRGAQAAVSSAGKPTAGGIRANMAQRLAKLRAYAKNVKTLKDRGLNAVTLSELLAMGPEAGADFAAALVSGGLGNINALQADINREAANLGLTAYRADAASGLVTGTAAANAAGLVAAGGIVMKPAPVTIAINGKNIADALVAYKRENGGRIPGL